MAKYLDDVPFSGIIRIRDMMYSVKDPFRLDQGDVSFDTPAHIKAAMIRAIEENKTHYVNTAGLPELRRLAAEKLRTKNRIPVGSDEEMLVTNGGIHGIYMTCLALLDPGDEVILPDPEWPPAAGNVKSARGVVVGCPLHESLGFRWDLEELELKITARTRAIFVNSPHNPTGGVFERADLERIAEIARARNLWVISDEPYEDILYDDAEHVSIASLPGMYERTVSVYTFSKSYSMTGLRLGYLAVRDPRVRERMTKVLFYTASNIASVVQYGGIAALAGPQDCIAAFREELKHRRDLFYRSIEGLSVLEGVPPRGAFYAFLRIADDWPGPRVTSPNGTRGDSWAMTELLLKSRIGCVPGVDFGPAGEGYIRFCFARERAELAGALEAVKALFAKQLM